MGLEAFNTQSDPTSHDRFCENEATKHASESEEHFKKKVDIAKELSDNGWEVELEKQVSTGNIADVYAVLGQRVAIIEVGHLEDERREKLENEFSEVYNFPYEVAGQKVVGEKTRSDVSTCSVSFTDEAYFRIIETKPDDTSFSEWVETLAMKGINARNEEQDDQVTSTAGEYKL